MRPGSTIHVTGSGFGRSGTASLAGVAAAATWSDTSIAVTVPAGVGAGGLTLQRSTGDLQQIVMTPQEKVRPEIELLFRAVAREARRKPNAKSAPNLGALLPGLDLRHVETRHCHEERRRQVSPSRITIEIRHLHEVPSGRQRVPDE